MGALLGDDDEGLHPTGPAGNWNESRYVDFWDAAQRVGGWFRIGNRPNEGHGEVSACVYLPGGRIAFWFERAGIVANTLSSGAQAWQVLDPWRAGHVSHRGPVLLLDDPWLLRDPKLAFETAPRVEAQIDLSIRTAGLQSVMGSDQDHIDRIFLPGQADFHYQHLAHCSGTVHVGAQHWVIDGRGGKDHSWGPRNWHAKIYLRWIICAFDDANGFMLVRAVGPGKQTRSGFVLEAGRFHLVDDFKMHNEFAAAPHYELRRMTLTIHSSAGVLDAVGTAQSWVPLRHVKREDGAEPVLLRMVKSPMEWTDSAGRRGAGHCEIQDTMRDGKPIGLAD